MKICREVFLFTALKIIGFSCVILSANYLIYANDISENLIIEKEREARQLSNIWSSDSYRRSISLYEESAAQWISNGQFQKAAHCLRESAKLYRITSDYKNSLEALNRALKFDTRTNDVSGKIISLSLISLVSRQNGEIKQSEKFYKQALSLNKFSADNPATAYSFLSAAMYNFYNGDAVKSIDYFEQAYLYAEKTDDVDLIAESLLYVGYSKSRENDPTPALEKMNTSLEICRKHDNKRCLTQSYFGLGYLHSLLDEKQIALNYFKKAEELYPSDFEWLERAKLYSNISTIYEQLGDLELSETYGKKAFDFYEKANYPYGQLAILPNLARLEYLKGDKTASLDLFTKALDLAGKQNDKLYLAYIKQGIGDLNLTFENYDDAVKNYRHALEVYKSLNIKLPDIKLSLGKAYEMKGDFLTAEKFYNDSLTENREIKSDQSVSECLYNLSKLNNLQGNSAKSLLQITESLKITESLYEDVNNDKLKSSFFSNVYERYESFINLMMKMHAQSSEANDFSRQALQAAERSRARSMLEKLTLSEANFNQDADAETIRNEKRIRLLLNGKVDKLTDLLSQNNKSEVDKISGEINELEHQLEEIKADLKQNSPIYSAIKNPAPFDVGEFQQNVLDENSLLLEFSFGKQESYLWLVGKNEFSSYVLPPRERIESKIEILRALLQSREKSKDESIEIYQARIAKADEDYRKIADDLSQEIFGQVAEKFGDKRLIIVPDGKLNYFPVSALPLPDSAAHEPLLLSNEVVYQPSASTLSILAKERERKAQASKSLLIFSDPVFSAEDSRLSPENKNDLSAQNEADDKFRFVESLNSLARLDSSKTEADSIVDILGKSNADNFSGFAANRERLLNVDAADYKILHFATHGLIDENRPELSGIVLSRFDENGQKLDEFFRLHDIYGMNLNSDLVVLSACFTGVGKEVKGEGLMSLNNAFLSVGAKTVLSSFWKVEDGATLELMQNFYDAMTSEQLTPSKALQKAQIKMLKSERYKSPFYWAAFTVQGDFKNVPQISKGHSVLRYFLPVFLILLLGAGWRFAVIRRRNRT